MSEHIARVVKPTIYAYTCPHYKETEWTGAKTGLGLLKVGYTEQENVENRIWQQFPTKTPVDKPFEILLIENALIDNEVDETKKFFTDHAVHSVLSKKGFKRVNGEWFECTVNDVKNAILEIKTKQPINGGRHDNFGLRPEQQHAINLTCDYFKQYPRDDKTPPPHFLWNAKMRFGKTFTTYKLAEKMGWKKILVLTYKPAVQSAWKEDLLNHVDFDGWQFIGKDDKFNIDENKPLVWFASFQDILGTDKNGEIKNKFELAHVIEWDCVVLDEYHFGAWRESARDLYDAEKEIAKEIEKDKNFSEETFPLDVKNFLYLSGTPFRALMNGEFLEDQIFNWTYSDEQREKENWNDRDGENPYLELPKIVMMTYQIPDAIREVALKGDTNEFDLNLFFKAKEVDGENGKIYEFEYKDQVQQWLSLIRGQYLAANPTAGSDGVKPPIPFEDSRLLAYLNHTFWFLPFVASCKAMAQLLAEKQNVFYHEYNIIVAAGTEAGSGVDALKPVKDAMGNPLKTKTITLSCGKLTTGVSVSPWSGIFFLKNTNSPETYFQAAFRVQNPWYIKNQDGLDPHKKEIIKPICYIFDFAPSRALQLISEYSGRLDLNSDETVEQRIAEFIKFLPVLCYDGFHMQQLNAGELLDIVASGTASSMLAARWSSAQLVNVDNMTLERLLRNKEMVAALENIEAFRNLSKDISRVISSEKALNKVKKDGEKVSKEQEKEQDKEKKENQSFKTQLREKLLKFVTRVPIFMYLTDNREECLKDVITELEPELFTKVTGLKVSDFETLCEIGVFNSQNMNSAIFAFKRFEEGSLTYIGGIELSENVGGFDISLSRDEAALVIEGL